MADIKFRSPTMPPGNGGSGGGGGGKGGNGGGSHGRNSLLPDTAIVGSIIGGTGIDLITKGFMANAQVQQQVTLSEADQRNTPAVMGNVQAQIANLQKKYPALTQLEGLKLYSENQGIFGDPAEALSTLAGSVRLQQLYQLKSTGEGGSGGDENLAASKAGDALQAFIDPKTNKVDTGLFKPVDQLPNPIGSGGGAALLTRNPGWHLLGLRALGALASTKTRWNTRKVCWNFPPSRTGTALNSAFQLFGASTNHLTDKTKAAWSKAGLLGKAGEIINQLAYQADPYTWIWNTLKPALAKQGITTRAQILAWLSANGQRSTVSGLFADIAIGETNLQKTKTRFDAQDPNTVDKLQNTDIGKLQALSAAQNNFFIALGKFESGPGVSVLVSFTNALNNITEWANKNPGLAKDLVEIGAGTAIFADVAGKLAMTIYLGAPLVSGLASLARSAPGLARAGTALVTTADGLALLGTRLAPFIAGGPVALAMGALIAFLLEFPKAMDAINAWLGFHGPAGRHNPGALTGPPPFQAAPPPISGPRHDGVGRSVHQTAYDETASAHLATLAGWVVNGAHTTIDNPRDIANGAANYIKTRLQMPNTGPSGFNPRATPSGSAALAVQA